MRLLLAGAVVMLAGLALLLSMVVRLIDPDFVLSLLGYATMLAGMFLGIMGGAALLSGRRRRVGARPLHDGQSGRLED